ncbi:lipase [Russula compacta]|nr:lipase [Russula compacta]
MLRDYKGSDSLLGLRISTCLPSWQSRIPVLDHPLSVSLALRLQVFFTMSLFRLIIIATVVGLASAATPTRRQSYPTLAAQQMSSYSPYTYYAATPYCGLDTFKAWNCGVNCQENPHFEIFDAGGNGDGVQYWYVGYDPDQDTVIVAHQGTNTEEILADLTDLDVLLVPLDSSLFPNTSDSILVHRGFSEDQAQTASQVLSDVQQLITLHKTSTVTTVGHSLGAALSLLDSVYLRLLLPADIDVKFVGYGMPRIGNEEWADFVDEKLPGKVTHINNKKDPVPILPPMAIGYHHPSGEIHIQESGAWVQCPGQDNDSHLCIVGAVPDIFSSDTADHDGPYNGITMKC